MKFHRMKESVSVILLLFSWESPLMIMYILFFEKSSHVPKFPIRSKKRKSTSTNQRINISMYRLTSSSYVQYTASRIYMYRYVYCNLPTHRRFRRTAHSSFKITEEFHSNAEEFFNTQISTHTQKKFKFPYRVTEKKSFPCIYIPQRQSSAVHLTSGDPMRTKERLWQNQSIPTR